MSFWQHIVSVTAGSTAAYRCTSPAGLCHCLLWSIPLCSSGMHQQSCCQSSHTLGDTDPWGSHAQRRTLSTTWEAPRTGRGDLCRIAQPQTQQQRQRAQHNRECICSIAGLHTLTAGNCAHHNSELSRGYCCCSQACVSKQ